MPIALIALSLAAFSVGTGEFVIAGILPILSADLGVSIPKTGLLVAVYAAAVAMGGPILAVLTAGLPRKPMIVVLLVCFTLGQAFCALAPTYFWLMAARIFVACCHGLFFGVASVAAIGLVPDHRRGMAMALFLGGITIANVFGIPFGTAIGDALGWRWTFGAIGVFGLIATLAVGALLPADQSQQASHTSVRTEIAALNHHQVYLSYLVIGLVMAGILAFATYQVPLMITVTGVAPERTPIFLLISGIGSIVGMYAGGRAADWKLMPSLMAMLLAQLAMTALMFLAMHGAATMAIGMFFFGAISWTMNAPLQSRILSAARAAPNLAATLISTAYNIGIALGAWVGAVWIDLGLGYQSLPVVGIGCSLAATVVATFSWALDRRTELRSSLGTSK
jgi:MFS transporter, DHA1 family, inner membrane transport protein